MVFGIARVTSDCSFTLNFEQGPVLSERTWRIRGESRRHEKVVVFFRFFSIGSHVLSDLCCDSFVQFGGVRKLDWLLLIRVWRSAVSDDPEAVMLS